MTTRDAPPLVIGWGHSRVRTGPGWMLGARWPLRWCAARGLCEVVELDERAGDRARHGPTLRARINTAPPGTPVLTFGVWFLEARAIHGLRTSGFRLVARLDDDYWNLPPWQPDLLGSRAETIAFVEAALRAVDQVITSTAPLAERVAPFAARPPLVIPNALDVASIPRARPNTGEKVRVGWMGTATHGGDLDAVRAPIEALLRRYARARLVIMTPKVPAWLGAHPQVEQHAGVADFPTAYYQKLADLHLDIGIAPLAAHVFNESKSNLKALDFASLGLPLVASRVGPYTDLPHGQTCLTIPDNDPDAWLDALSALIEDPERRRTMGTAARAWVETHGSLDQTGPLWAEALGLAVPVPAAESVA